MTSIRGSWRKWEPGDPVYINRIIWGQPEIDQIQSVLDNDWFGPGVKVQQFGQLLADYIEIPLVQSVNSGSSALMLAIRALLQIGRLKPGDWVLHPVLTFPTSIAPAIQSGLVPVFVDVDPHTYQIDLSQAQAAIELYPDMIKGAVIPHLLGNICDIEALLDILGNRVLIEDCCDTLGGTFNGHHVGSFGEVCAFSFYGSHHITTAGVGGAVATKHPALFEIIKSMTHWGRTDYSRFTDTLNKFAYRYWYDTLGFDFQMTEIQAAFGIAQLARLPAANEVRHARFMALVRYFQGKRDWFYLPYTDPPKAAPSWFAYPLTIKPEAPFTREDIIDHLTDNKIETRPMFTGNILRHPALRSISGDKKVLVGETKNADLIGQNSFFLPAWAMSEHELNYMLAVLDSFFMDYV